MAVGQAHEDQNGFLTDHGDERRPAQLDGETVNELPTRVKGGFRYDPEAMEGLLSPGLTDDLGASAQLNLCFSRTRK